MFHSSDLRAFSNEDQLHACSWIRSHLEEHTDTCLPKQDVYESYKRYCDNLHYWALSASNFGKIIRDVFPNVKARRLGGRGQSKYCYSGIRRKTVLNMPLLPSLDLKNDPSELTELVQTYNSEVTEAACSLICDWAERILKRSFDTVVEIARFLIQEHIVNPRSSTAHTIMSASLAGGPAKPHKVVKKTLQPPRGSGVKRAESSPAAQREKESGERSAAGKQLLSESSDSPRAGGRDSQVEAVMKRYPQLLPRGPVLQETRCLRGSPPTITMAAAPLTQQQGALPVLILPPLSYPAPAAPSKERASIIRSRGAPKRPADPPSGDTPKRKRGRPRKARMEDAEPPPRGVIQRAAPGGQTSNAIEVVIKHEPSAVIASIKSLPPPSLASPETQPPPSLASPETQPLPGPDSPETQPLPRPDSPKTQPLSVLDSPKIQPLPILDSPKTQPLSSLGSPETQPLPSSDSTKTQPLSILNSPKTQPLPSPASPKTQPLSRLDSPETQPLPSSDSTKTQPLSSLDSPKTQPLPSLDSPKTQPLSSLDSPKTQPLPSLDSPKTEPLSSLDSPKTQPLPSLDSTKTQPLPSLDSPKTQPLPRLDSPKTQPPPSLTAQGRPIEAPHGNPADQASQSRVEGRGLVEVIQRTPTYAPLVAGPVPEVGEAGKSTEKPANIPPPSSRAESQPASQSPRQSGAGKQGSEPQSPASHPDLPPSSQTPNQG
ncbi:pollen-specific leucine-rich repeat extensin-like protein 1 [Polyodon spathula]|uniref:pollen-specific leucine-rich repeat extensin-like protein 1 n=1 Tax=Polyodon spathula TaxID=7913 RepID=UPI001B7E8281|nr:pollen-specific leucine-rich repeat extensin-like protein 1 [Polyodon spathula]